MQPVQSAIQETVDPKERYLKVRHKTELLCEPLETEDYVPQPIADVSPIKWNIAHTTWFFEEMILKHFVEGYREVDPLYSFLFNSYYNAVGDRTLRHKRGDLSRPTVAEVFKYRERVDEAMCRLLTGNPSERVLELAELGINHEQQHQELFLTDLKYTFSLNPVDPVYRSDFALVESAEPQVYGYEDVAGGLYEIGFEGEGFCFDNELARHKVFLEDFSIARGLVTNGEYLEFIEDGGYSDSRLWHSEGWDWLNENGVDSPLYWSGADGERYQ